MRPGLIVFRAKGFVYGIEHLAPKWGRFGLSPVPPHYSNYD